MRLGYADTGERNNKTMGELPVTDKTHAVGQMQGYLRQVQQMFNELISLDEITVSIEALDDVAVQNDDGSVIVEQMKSITSGDNPTADRSSVFWKTISRYFDTVFYRL